MAALDHVPRPIHDDLEHSGTCQDDGKPINSTNHNAASLRLFRRKETGRSKEKVMSCVVPRNR